MPKKLKTIILSLAIFIQAMLPAVAVELAPGRPIPVVVGDFLQGWQFAATSRAAMLAHFEELAEAGIEYIVLQEVARTENGRIWEAYYPSSSALNDPNSNHPYGNDLLENMFIAAKQTGLKVFVGLNFASPRWGGQTGWWRTAPPWTPINDRAWYVREAELGNAIALEIYDMFMEQYSDVFYGWYFSFEYFNNMQGFEANYAEFFNINRDFLYELTPHMPVAISPFFAADYLGVEQSRTELRRFFRYANFRPGDIYAPQDAVGTGRTSVAQAGAYFRMIREVLDEEIPYVRFWANNENFNPPFDPPPYSPTFMNRFISQIAITNPYVDRHITFSYTHYYASILRNNRNFHNAYLRFRQDILNSAPDWGDVDANGAINAADITFLRRYIAATNKADFLAQPENVNFDRANADTDWNGTINSADVTLLRRFIASGNNHAQVRIGPR